MFFCVFFFFKQKTAYELRMSDWSSDVCSSDLVPSSRHSAYNRRLVHGFTLEPIMLNTIKTDAQTRMTKSVEALRLELTKLRTGRASTALVDHLKEIGRVSCRERVCQYV